MDKNEIKKLVLSLNEELEKTLNEEDREKIQEQIEKLNEKLEKIKKEEEKKLEEKAKKEKEKKAKKEKKETAEKGSLKEVFSCLFGQVDKRVNNFIASKPKLSSFIDKRRVKRYDNIYTNIIKYVGIPAAVAIVGLVSTSFVSGAMLPVIPVIAGSIALVNTVRYIPTLIRKITNKGPKKISKVELSKGSYLENLKNAISKFRNRKTVKKEVSLTAGKTTSKKDEPITTKSAINEKNKNIDNLLINFNNAVNSVDLSDIDMTKADNCNSCYELLKNHGEVALNKISKENMEKYKKIQDYVKLVREFSKAVNALKNNGINNELLDNCKSLYEILKNNYGENAFKNISSDVMQAYNEMVNESNKKETKLETKLQENEEKFVLQNFVNDLRDFRLEKTTESIREYEKLMHRLFALKPEQRASIRNNEALWNKVTSLRQEVRDLQTKYNLKSNNDVLARFIKLVETFEFGENINFDSNNLMASITLYNNLTADQKRMVPEKIMQKYQDAIRYDSITALKAKLQAIDIEKCKRERNYDEIIECYHLYNKWYINDSKGLSQKEQTKIEKRKSIAKKEIESFSPMLKGKIKEILEVISEKEKYADALVNVRYQLAIINGQTRPISHVEILTDDNVITERNILWNSNNPNVDEIKNRIMEEFPFISEEQINFEGISKENNRGNRR